MFIVRHSKTDFIAAKDRKAAERIAQRRSADSPLHTVTVEDNDGQVIQVWSRGMLQTQAGDCRD